MVVGKERIIVKTRRKAKNNLPMCVCVRAHSYTRKCKM